MIKAIIFDAGGVIWKTSYEDILEALAEKLKIDPERVISLDNEIKEDLLTGKMSVREECSLIRDRFNLNLSPEEIFRVFSDTYDRTRKINEELFNLAKELRNRCRVALISNVSDMSAHINKKEGYYSIFDPCILSCEAGLAKPDKKIFELALEKLNLKGEECVFIDDRDHHFPEAKKLGCITILFQNNKQVIEELNSLMEL